MMDNPSAPLQLGDTARDSVTGFTGTVVCLSQWLHAELQVTVQPTELNSGSPIAAISYPEGRWERVEEATERIGLRPNWRR